MVTSDIYRDCWHVWVAMQPFRNLSLLPYKVGLPLVLCRSGFHLFSPTRGGGCKNPKSSKRGQCFPSLCQSSSHGQSQNPCGLRLHESASAGRTVTVVLCKQFTTTLLIPSAAITKKSTWACLSIGSSFQICEEVMRGQDADSPLPRQELVST